MPFLCLKLNSMKKIAILVSALVLASGLASAQGTLSRLKERAKNAVENNIGNKIEKGINDALDGKKKDKDNSGKNAGEGAVSGDGITDADAQNQKNDFVRGGEILFVDNFDGEQMGEFPSKWDLNEGGAEVASIDGKKYLSFTDDYNFVAPLMTNMESYLPDVFTLEWDMFCSKGGEFGGSELEVIFMKQGSWNDRAGSVSFTYRSDNPDAYGSYRFEKANGANGEANGGFEWNQIKKFVKIGQWNHFAVSFNQRAFKYYINGNRVINLPNAKAPERLLIWCGGNYKYKGITNVVLAAGAKDLYERQATYLSEEVKSAPSASEVSAVEKAIAETGKFVTNNILFDTGKATLKQESMIEIMRVAQYMKNNPTARFEVQGHTDNQGSDKINDPLSQQRAEAIVKALEGLGVDGFNLKAVGKGSHEPVADNGTEEGRAKNRRVEFIKK